MGFMVSVQVGYMKKSHDGASYIFSMTYGMQNYVGREVIKIYSGFCINSAP